MTQRRVENTRVHFWTFSPVPVKSNCILIIILYGNKTNKVKAFRKSNPDLGKCPSLKKLAFGMEFFQDRDF